MFLSLEKILITRGFAPLHDTDHDMIYAKKTDAKTQFIITYDSANNNWICSFPLQGHYINYTTRFKDPLKLKTYAWNHASVMCC